MSGLTQVLGEFSGTDDTYYLLGLDVIGQQRGSTWNYFGTDALGSTRFLMDANRAVTYSADYAPYGTLMAQSGTGATPFGFTGEQSDATGLQYLRARYYNPQTATFLSRDPVLGAMGISGSYNGYSYGFNNPVMYADPTGEFPWLLVGLFAFGFSTDAAFQMAFEGRSLHEVDGWRSVVAGGTSIFGFGAGRAISAVGLTGRAAFAVGATADFSVGVAADRYLLGDGWGTAVASNMIGFGVGEFVGYAGKGIARSAGYNIADGVRYGPSAQDYADANRIIGARRAEAIGGGRFDIRMELGDNVGGTSPNSITSPYFMRVATDEYGYTIPYPSVDTWNMVKTAKTIKRTTHGGIRDMKNFWRTWQRDFPETLSERNRRFLKANSAPQVDDVWIQHFPEMSLYRGQTLVHHHVDLGRYAIPLPANLHGRSGVEPFLAGSDVDPYTVWHPREMEIREARQAFRKRNRK